MGSGANHARITAFEKEMAAKIPRQSAVIIPRRIRLDKFTPAEKAIYDAMQAVETLPPDTRLTEAVILLDKARELVADFVDEN